MKNISIALVAVAALCTGLAAQDRVDFSVIEKIRAEGMERSKILETFDYLVTAIGPRLTNSPAHKRADRVDAGTDEGDGPERGARRAVPVRPRLDARTRSRSRWSSRATCRLIGYPQGWSPSTAGRIVATPVWMPGLEDEAMKAQAGKLKGAILFTSPIQQYAIRADRPAASGDLKPPDPRRPARRSSTPSGSRC